MPAKMLRHFSHESRHRTFLRDTSNIFDFSPRDSVFTPAVGRPPTPSPDTVAGPADIEPKDDPRRSRQRRTELHLYFGAMTVPSRAAASVRLFLLRCIHSVYLMHLAFAEALRSLQMNLWLRRSALSAAIPRVPAHLGLALGDEPIDMRKLADLVGSCAELGIHRITLCDAHGMLLQARE